MKIIKINKTFKGGKKEHYLVLLENYSNEDIDDLVEEWCATDISGSNYGYDYEWSVINNDDNILIKNILNDKINIINNKINKLENEKKELIKHLNKYKY